MHDQTLSPKPKTLPKQMTAFQRHRYGGPEVVQTAIIPRPEPKSGELLIEVQASAVTTGDWRIRAAAFPGVTAPVGRLMFGIRKPRDPALGSSFAGVVAAVGPNVTGFVPGQRVFGLGARSHAQYMVIKAEGCVAELPNAISDVEASALPFGATCALVFLREIVQLQNGEHILIPGGSGGVGSMAIQIAKLMGAEVTAMASAANLDLLREVGADHVIDYRSTPVSAIQGPFDAILDPVSALTPRQAKRLLTPKGRFVPLEFSLADIGAALFWPLTSKKRTKLAVSADRAQDLRLVAEWLRAGQIKVIIDQVLPFAQAQEAHARVQSRHAKGAVVLQGW